MHPTLSALLDAFLVAGTPVGDRAIAGNFRMEERLPADMRDSYGSYFSSDPIAVIDDWRGMHKDFLDDHVNLIRDEEHPWTFRPVNQANLKAQDPITVLRIESLDAAVALSGTALSVPEIEQRVRELHTGTPVQQRSAETALARFVDGWNNGRDRRPQFATNLTAVQEMLPDTPWSGAGWDWVSDLRDHLGLGGHVPKASGEPFPVLLMRYAIEDIKTGCRPTWDGRVTVPTVLDGDLFEYFFPSPVAPTRQPRANTTRSVAR